MDDVYIAPFELGIKFGALYHQFIGTPINPNNISVIERAIESSISAQPYVTDVKVEIKKDVLYKKVNKFGYAELSGDMLKVRITVIYRGWRATGVLDYDEENHYPYMKLVSLEHV